MFDNNLAKSDIWTRQRAEKITIPFSLPLSRIAGTATRARLGDEYPISRLLLDNAPVCLPVSPAQLIGCLPFYRVVHQGERIVGTFALFPINAECYELRSVAVAEDQRGQGLGRRLVSEAVQRAAYEGRRLYCVTTKPEFFAHFGFQQVPLGVLPPKPERQLFPSEGTSFAMYWDLANTQYLDKPGDRKHEELRCSA